MGTPAIPPHDAQRELEQRALRNVRALVDKVEGDDQARRRRSLRLLAWLIAGMVVGVVAAYVAIRLTHGPGESRVITIEPAKRGETGPGGAK